MEGCKGLARRIGGYEYAIVSPVQSKEWALVCLHLVGLWNGCTTSLGTNPPSPHRG